VIRTADSDAAEAAKILADVSISMTRVLVGFISRLGSSASCSACCSANPPSS